MLAQRTIRNKTSATGVGLHTGKKAVLTLHPADPDTGIIFRRIDGDKVIEMPAQANMVGNTTLATTLEKDGYEINFITIFFQCCSQSSCLLYTSDAADE